MNPVEMIGNLISAHPYATLAIFGGYFLLSNVVAALPSPDKGSGKMYKFWFTLGHGLVGSFPRIIPSLRLPSDPTRTDPSYFGKPDPNQNSAQNPPAQP